jgi:hypothetical protein
MKLVNDTNCVFIVGQILFSEETYIHGMLVNKKKRDSLKTRQIMHVMEIEENVKHDNLLKYYEDAKNKKLH